MIANLAPHLLTRFPPENQTAFRQALAESRILGIQAVANLFREQVARQGPEQLWRQVTQCAPPWPNVWGEWHMPWPWGEAPERGGGTGPEAPHLGTMVVSRPITPDEWKASDTPAHAESRLDLFCFGSHIPNAWAGTVSLLIDVQGSPCRSQERPHSILKATRLSDPFLELAAHSPELAPIRSALELQSPEEIGISLLQVTWVLPMLLALTYYNRRQIFVLDSQLMVVSPSTPDEPARLTPLHTFYLPLADPRNN